MASPAPEPRPTNTNTTGDAAAASGERENRTRLLFTDFVFPEGSTFIRTRHNNLRCFPSCSPVHKTNTFCGSPIYVKARRVGPLHPDSQQTGEPSLFGSFHLENEGDGTLKPNSALTDIEDRVASGAVLRARMYRQDEEIYYFIFMPDGKWTYAATLQATDRHYFTVVLVSKQGTILDVLSSPYFHVIPTWKVPKSKPKPKALRPSSESVEMTEDDEDEESEEVDTEDDELERRRERRDDQRRLKIWEASDPQNRTGGARYFHPGMATGAPPRAFSNTQLMSSQAGMAQGDGDQPPAGFVPRYIPGTGPASSPRPMLGAPFYGSGALNVGTTKDAQRVQANQQGNVPVAMPFGTFPQVAGPPMAGSFPGLGPATLVSPAYGTFAMPASSIQSPFGAQGGAPLVFHPQQNPPLMWGYPAYGGMALTPAIVVQSPMMSPAFAVSPAQDQHQFNVPRNLAQSGAPSSPQGSYPRPSQRSGMTPERPPPSSN